jgi:6-phosphogluconolactonase
LVFAAAASDGGGNGISVFKVNANGSLTLLTSTPVPTQSAPDSVVVDHWGKYLYATSQTSIEAFAIDSVSGALTPIPGSPYKISGFVSGCVASPSDVTESYGRFLYLSDRGIFNLGYAITGKTGSLTELSGSPFPDAGDCGGLTTEPTGRFLYVSNASWPVANVSIYSINAGNGALTHVKDTPVSEGFGRRYGLHVDPSGQFLYFTGSDIINQFFVFGFSIDEHSGDLTALPGSPFSIGAQWAFDFVLTP